MTDSFLPEGYETPKTESGYMKFITGENKIRILSKPIIGWEDWLDKVPLRFKMSNKPSAPLNLEKPVKHFWAFVVWNYNESKIQILEITQASIQKKIKAYSQDPDWGNPMGYDIKITKKVTGDKTEYDTTTIPHKKITEEVASAYKAKPINLLALFDGADPFQVTTKTVAGDLPF